MSEPSLKRDLVFLIPLFIATWFGLLRFAHKKDVRFAIRGPLSLVLALLRLGLVFACIEWYALEFNVSVLFFVGTIVFIYLMLVAELSGPGLDWLAAMAIAFAFITYQWVFWFPVIEELTSKTAIDGAPEKPPSGLIGKHGTATTPLRPGGRVVVENTEYEAKSELHFVDTDAKIEVIDVKDSSLIVREI
jgi:membrane-bound ClpP family serine protease